MATSRLILEVNEKQKQAILAFVNANDWDIKITEQISKTDDASHNNDSGGEELYPMQRHQAGENECPFCFCAPCIVSEGMRQMWWPDTNHEPSHTNSCARRPLYKRFWAMLQNCGAWNDPRYNEKKIMARRGDGTWHRRELMPECVVTKCRQWLPNPESLPYMGHKWE